MIERFSEFAAYLMIRYKIVNIEDRDVCIYFIETFILNFMILGVFFLECLIFSAVKFYLIFSAFVIPLRIFSGGYHAKTSSGCFVLSIIMLGAVTMLYKLIDCDACRGTITVIGCISALLILIFAPVRGENHSLSERRYNENRRIVIGLISVYFSAAALLMWLSSDVFYIIIYACAFVSANIVMEKISRVLKFIVEKADSVGT